MHIYFQFIDISYLHLIAKIYGDIYIAPEIYEYIFLTTSSQEFK